MAKDLRGNSGKNNLNNMNLDEDTLKKYVNKSEQELMAELMKNAGESRQSGKLTDADLDNLVAQMRGNMSTEQFMRLQMLTNMLKGKK